MKNLLYSFVLGGLALSMTSCLKDDDHFTDFQSVGAVAEIPSAAFYGIADNQGLLIQTAPTSYSFDVNIASPAPLTQDITVTLALDKAALDAYNAANTTSYQLLPTTLYQISSLTTTVKAGSRLAPINLTFYSGADKVPDPIGYNDAAYALPLKITTASNNVAVSSNYGTKIIFLKIKNDYAGDYRSVGTFNHPTAGTRAINRDKTLATIDASTVQTEYADLGATALMWLKVNADNTVTLTPKGTASTATVQFGENKYDPTTHAYTLNYKYAGAGGDRVINEVIKLK
ncbi:BT_3987 domain-containing protein [Spirosoma flavum]|uniref:BT_3987 domain-containing protein n=1 Tax=Spirosoma flavum TaxID=2048557 RepID=A0ABW6AHF5_9BACT